MQSLLLITITSRSKVKTKYEIENRRLSLNRLLVKVANMYSALHDNYRYRLKSGKGTKIKRSRSELPRWTIFVSIVCMRLSIIKIQK